MSDTLPDIHQLLKDMEARDASDLFITAGLPPSYKIHGRVTPTKKAVLTPEHSQQIALRIMTDTQREEFTRHQECNFAISIENVGRFRVNVFRQKQNTGLVMRKIKTQIPSLEELGLPPGIKELSLAKRGLVIVVGATGSGKSTTLAAMIEHRNQHDAGHIICIEDPIEFIHEHKSSIITQREVGIDTDSFEDALKNTLRQAPDVILIGEIRSRETMQYAINFAETGHLCLATLHANNADQTLDRIINFFPEDSRSQLLLDLSLNLKAIIGQQLISTSDRKDRKLAVEILLNTPLSSKMIREGAIHKLKELMQKSAHLGMQTFDQSLYQLYLRNAISYEDAIHHSDHPNELRLLIKLGKEKSQETAPKRNEITLIDPEA